MGETGTYRNCATNTYLAQSMRKLKVKKVRLTIKDLKTTICLSIMQQ